MCKSETHFFLPDARRNDQEKNIDFYSNFRHFTDFDAI
jgi:hypothetical protein